MDFAISTLPKSEAEIGVTIPLSEFEPHVKKAASLISEKTEIEGFRRGRAPYDVVKNKVGESVIYEEAAELAVRKTYPEVIMQIRDQESEKKNDFTPIGKPEITVTKLAPGNEFAYKVKLALLPTLALPDYKTIARETRAKKEDTAVNDEEVNKAVQWLREARTSLVTVNRKAEKGDRVEVDFEIRHGGVKIKGGESHDHPLILGEGRFLPGFEDELTGMEAGEKKEFMLTAPGDWKDKQFAGKSLDFSATIKLVQERRIPELTDEFAKGLGKFASADALKQNVREGLLQEKTQKETQRVRALMMQGIADQTRVEIPDVLVAGELEKMFTELKSGVEQMGMQWEDYLVHIKKTPQELENEWRGEATQRVKIALCLRQIAREEHIDPLDEEITARASQILAQYESPEDAAKNIDPARSQSPEATADSPTASRTSNGIDPAELKEYTRGILKNEKVFEFLETT